MNSIKTQAALPPHPIQASLDDNAYMLFIKISLQTFPMLSCSVAFQMLSMACFKVRSHSIHSSEIHRDGVSFTQH